MVIKSKNILRFSIILFRYTWMSKINQKLILISSINFSISLLKSSRSGSKSLAVLLLSLLKILNFTADPFSTDFSDKTVFSHRSQSSRTLKYPLRNSSSQAWYIFIRVCVVSIRIVADLMASSQFDNDQKILITKMVGSLLSKIKRDRKMAIHMWQCVFRNNLLRRPAESEFIYNGNI